MGQLSSAYAGKEDANVPPDAKAIATKIVKEADKRMGRPVITITENKNLQASKDPHDYFSTARYYWPDPSKPDGLPYIRKDGETNPEHNEVSDEKKLNDIIHAVEYLALAYLLTGHERYAEEAGRFLRGFFLEPATRMNPNMNYSQSVPGGAQGRGSGVIDSREFMRMADCLVLISKSHSWTDQDRSEMKAWWTEYAQWLQTSKIGLEEKKAPNNHGAVYEIGRAHV